MQGIIVLIIYALIMVGATFFFTKRENSGESFHVGNRNMGTISSAMSVAATWIWAPALFTSAEKAYTDGFAGLFWFLVPNVMCLLLFIPFAKKIRREMPGGITLSGYMYEKYKSKAVRNIYLFQLTMLTILSTAVQLLAGGKILSIVAGMPLFPMTIILAAIAFSYAQISGIRASVLTDGIQMVFLLAACAVFVPWALEANGGAVQIAGVSGEYGQLFSRKGIEVLLGFGLPTAIGLLAGPFGDQCFWQRAFSIRKDRMGRAFVIGAVLFAIVPLSMGILGFAAAGMGFIPNETGNVGFELIKNLFPSWAMLLFMFMLISGLLSTVDSNLCAIASLTTDISKGGSGRAVGKGAMLALLGIGILIANIPGLTVTHMFLFYCTFRAATMLPTMLTLGGIRMKPSGVTAGVISALVVGLPTFAYGTIYNIPAYKTVGSLLTVLLAGIVAVAVSKIPKMERWKRHGK